MCQSMYNIATGEMILIAVFSFIKIVGRLIHRGNKHKATGSHFIVNINTLIAWEKIKHPFELIDK